MTAEVQNTTLPSFEATNPLSVQLCKVIDELGTRSIDIRDGSLVFIKGIEFVIDANDMSDTSALKQLFNDWNLTVKAQPSGRQTNECSMEIKTSKEISEQQVIFTVRIRHAFKCVL